MALNDEMPPALRRSALLHERVLTFARSQFGKLSSSRFDGDSFETLALDIARFQYDLSPGFARSVQRRTGRLKTLSDLPIVPTDAFRLTRVATHPPDLDEVVFKTSGTTGDECGRHPLRSLHTKTQLTILQAKRSLFSKHPRGIVVALAPPPEESPSSSLTHLMMTLIEHFDGRALTLDPEGVSFNIRGPGRFLFPSQGADVEGLRRAAKIALHRSEPLFILTSAFALLAMLENLDGEELSCPSRTTVMLTGGFKGRKTELSEAGLRRECARIFSIPESQIQGEYGMTELSSQLFEEEKSGVYVPPPWLRLTALDPRTLEPVSEGEAGLAQFIDLANIDSCLSILTQDKVRKVEGGFELLGRSEEAPPRGCSLPFEGLLSSSSNVSTLPMVQSKAGRRQ